MRYGLLMTAVATVAVPGLLATLGVIDHDHVAAASAAAAAAEAGAAAQRAPGPPQPELSRVPASDRATGTRLLDKAAAAGQATTYQGTETISQSGMDGSVTMISQVWHQGGGLTVVETADNKAAPAATDVASSDPAGGSPEGVFGVTKPLVALLGKHYVALYGGGGSAAGRSAAVVELYRPDGSLAAQYWLDKQTMLPLRRVLLDPSDKVISEDSFTRVRFGALAASPAQGAVQPQSAPQPAWVTAASPGRFLASLSGQGWELPGGPAGGLPLYATAWTGTGNGEVVDLEYSDGLYVLSLFAQRGSLASSMPGWRPVRVDGQQAYVSGHSVTWAALGFVYTVIADAPPQTVTQVVGSLPGSGGQPSLLGRLARGLDRLARLFNPFG